MLCVGRVKTVDTKVAWRGAISNPLGVSILPALNTNTNLNTNNKHPDNAGAGAGAGAGGPGGKPLIARSARPDVDSRQHPGQ